MKKLTNLILHPNRNALTASIASTLALLGFSVHSNAATVSLIASDGFGTTSFNTGSNWSDAAAPSAGNDYVTGDFILRTPPDGASYTFAGDSLTVNNANGYPNGLLYKGTGAAGTITINNLILDGGFVSHANGLGDIFNLDGSINVISDSSIYARQGPINISAVISGSGTITNPGSDGDGRTLFFLSGLNTFAGNIVNNGRFTLADNANLNFVIGASGVNNDLSGSGAQNVFDGDFVFDLSGASSAPGDSWTIVSAANRTFGDTFSVAGFTDVGSDRWASPAGGGNYYIFDEATGILGVSVPEPSSVALLWGGIGLLAGLRRTARR